MQSAIQPLTLLEHCSVMTLNTLLTKPQSFMFQPQEQLLQEQYQISSQLLNILNGVH